MRSLTELRDGITREMFECSYDQLSEVSKGIVDKRVEEVRPRTSHDLALSLQKTAEWLLSRDAFRIESFDVATWQYLSFHEKEAFVAAVKAVGAGKKKFSDLSIEFEVKVPGGQIKLSAPREKVCRLIRPAEYECDPFLSPEEEKSLGGAA